MFKVGDVVRRKQPSTGMPINDKMLRGITLIVTKSPKPDGTHLCMRGLSEEDDAAYLKNFTYGTGWRSKYFQVDPFLTAARKAVAE